MSGSDLASQKVFLKKSLPTALTITVPANVAYPEINHEPNDLPDGSKPTGFSFFDRHKSD
jgi:hypothetical protein